MSLELKRQHTVVNFNHDYVHLGGVEQLLKMARTGKTLQEMSEYFGISKSGLSVKLSVLLGMNYREYSQRRARGERV